MQIRLVMLMIKEVYKLVHLLRKLICFLDF